MVIKNDAMPPLRKTAVKPYEPVHNVTAVIPALDEAGHIPDCIRSLERQSEILDIIVADGGSRDDTAAVAGASGASVIFCSRKGRGLQIREGIKHAQGDLILVIHADCRLRKGAAARVMAALNRDPSIAGGAFQMAFTRPTPSLRVIAGLNNLRARLTGISFGDQGQFARLEALDRLGGFPEQMLMEDVELSLRLKRVGGLILVDSGMDVSARRWRKGPFLKRVTQVLYLFIRYLVLHRTRGNDRQAQTYYRKYYK